MPGLASYEKKMRSTGLVVIGMAKQSDKGRALKLVSKSGVEFPIVNGGELPGIGASGFPTYILYGRDGQIVDTQVGAHGANGISEAMRATLEKALAEKSAALAVEMESFHEKSVIKLASRVNQGGALPGNLLKEIDAVIQGGTEKEKAEATRLRDEIVAYGRRMLDEAAPLKDESPHRHYDRMMELARLFKSHAIGDEAAAFVESVKGDAKLRDEIEASRLYANLQDAPGSQSKWNTYRVLKKKYPSTRFGRLAMKEMEPSAETK